MSTRPLCRAQDKIFMVTEILISLARCFSVEQQVHYHHVNKKNVIHRLSRIVGHIEGIKRMIEGETDCSDVLIQISAVRSALNNAGKIILADHINQCLLPAYKKNDFDTINKLNDAIDKYLK